MSAGSGRPFPGLLARLRTMGRAIVTADSSTTADPSLHAPAAAHQPDRELTARVAHLEQLVQGLQDSVYRETQRQEKRIADLEKRLTPASLAAALSKDARERGL